MTTIETISDLNARALTRRGAIGAAALTAAGAATIAAAPAVAAARDVEVVTFKGDYAIHGGTIVSGYFARPRGRSKLDVVVVLHDAAGHDAGVEATTRRYAAAGYLAVAPDLSATFARSGGAMSHDAMVAALTASVPSLRHLPHGNGRVTLVAA